MANFAPNVVLHFDRNYYLQGHNKHLMKIEVQSSFEGQFLFYEIKSKEFSSIALTYNKNTCKNKLNGVMML